MKGRLIRGIAVATLLSTTASSTGCGYFLYPERRGNTSHVDGGTLVMDLLWLLPGLVPGVVALIIDFSSGAIYTGRGGRFAVRMTARGNVAVRLPESPKPAQLEFRLVASDHRILAQRIASIGPDVHGQSIELRIGDTALPKNEKIYLEVVNANGASAQVPRSMEVAR